MEWLPEMRNRGQPKKGGCSERSVHPEQIVAAGDRADSQASEDHLRANLNVSGLAYGSVPPSEGRAGYVVDERSGYTPNTAGNEVVPVPQVEELTAQLEGHLLRDTRVLQYGNIMSLVCKASDVLSP